MMVDLKMLKRTTLAVATLAALAGAGVASAAVVSSVDSVADNVDGTGLSLQGMDDLIADAGVDPTGIIDVGNLLYELGTNYAATSEINVVLTLSGGCTWDADQTYYLMHNATDEVNAVAASDVVSFDNFSMVLVNGSELLFEINAAGDGGASGEVYTLIDGGDGSYLDGNGDVVTAFVNGSYNDAATDVPVLEAANAPNIDITDLDAAGDSCSVTAGASLISGSKEYVFDSSGTLSTVVATVYDQFSASVSAPFDQVVDVEADRMEFTDGTLVDSAELTVESDVDAVIDDGFYTLGATDEVALTLTGDDFAGIRSITDGTDTWTLSTATDTATFTLGADVGEALDGFGNAAEDDLNDIDVEVTGSATLNPVDFALTAVLNFADTGLADVTLLDAANAGGWGLNGLQAKIPYFTLNNTSAKNFLKIVNETDEDAEMTVDAVIQDLTTGTVVTAVDSAPMLKSSGDSLVATAGGVVNVSADDMVKTLGLGTDSYLVSLTVTVNAPADQIHVTGHLFTSSGRENLTVLYPTDAEIVGGAADGGAIASDRAWRQ